VSYQVELKPRLEDVQAFSVPKRCSSCYRQPADRRRLITTLLQVDKRTSVRWRIQVPLCDTCHEMYDVLYNYLPSKHGPPERRRENRWASLALVILSLLAVINIALPRWLVPWHTDMSKFLVVVVLGLMFIITVYWNARTSERARGALYQAMVEKAGYEFGDVQVQHVEPPRGLLPRFREKKEEKAPVVTFDNEAFGAAFEKANRGLLRSASSYEGQPEKDPEQSLNR
jgi:hypothetical protein